ncbi:MAG: M6 family metalloprotease domain-containing protein [Candidatus Electrothrix sp. AR4]|nr:M6 family metalloprotease domain-containing protein [Candidatus Electrothrix sp. AR4]
MAYYGADTAQSAYPNAQEFVTEAVNAANSDVNYADFDNDADGYVDGVYVIFAGYGQEAGASTDAIWAHAWGIPPVTLDGKTIIGYSCSPELRGNSDTDITRIGVICHELGHVLGAPDYYDTDGAANGAYQGASFWDLMAAGSWNNRGATPAHHNAFTKAYYYNWITMTELIPNQSVTIQPVEFNQDIFFYASPTTGEYWVLENRQQVGFDAALPGHGLIIHHVDRNNLYNLGRNCINCGHPQRMYPVCAAATTNPTSSAASYGDPAMIFLDGSAWVPGSIDSAACPFPGTGSKTAFTHSTVPTAKAWSGGKSDKSISNIQEIANDITFDFALSEPPASPVATSVLLLLLF